MPRIEFHSSARNSPKIVEAPEGGELLDICDEFRAPVPFSCRSASCATCQVEILAGPQFLEPPNSAEDDLLGLLGADDSRRLACQARVKPGSGVLVLRVVGVGP